VLNLMCFVTIRRDSSHICIHLAVLCIYDAHALYAPDRGAMMAWKHVTIYGNVVSCVYDMCCVDVQACTIRVVL
jgi:hypothetical protein